MRVGKRRGGGAGVLVVLEHPSGHGGLAGREHLGARGAAVRAVLRAHHVGARKLGGARAARGEGARGLGLGALGGLRDALGPRAARGGGGVDHHVALEELGELLGHHVEHLRLVGCLAQQLFGVEEHLGAVGRERRLARLVVDVVGERGAQKRRHEHHHEGGPIGRHERERVAWVHEAVVEEHHRHERCHHGEGAVRRHDGADERGQDVGRGDVLGGEAQGVEGKADCGGPGKQPCRPQQVSRLGHGEPARGLRDAAPGPAPAPAALGHLVRDDVDVEARRELDEAVGELGAAERRAPGGVPPHHELRDAREPRELGQLEGHVVAVGRDHVRAQLLGEPEVGVELAVVFVGERRGVGGLHVEGGELGLEGGGHAGRRAQDRGVGG